MAASDLASYIGEQRKDAACALGDFILRRIMQSDKKKMTVAKQAQISRPTLDKLISGKILNPNVYMLRRLERALELNTGALLRFIYPDIVPGDVSLVRLSSSPFNSLGQTHWTPKASNFFLDHHGRWCSICVRYFQGPGEIGVFHPYSRISLIDNPLLQELELEKVLGWTLPVHHYGCPQEGIALDAELSDDFLNWLLLCPTGMLENLGNITFYRGNINVNMAIRLILSHLWINERHEYGAITELAKATISNAGSNQSEMVGPILQSRMPKLIDKMTYPKVQVLLAEGNRARNLGYPDYAAQQCYGKAQWIIDKEIRAQNQTARAGDALDRRLMTVVKQVSSNDEEKIINNAKDHNEPYGYVTACGIVGYNNFRNKEYSRAEGNFRSMLRQDPDAIESWWHKMAGWLGLGATLYASNQSFDEAVAYCLMAEYVSAMLSLRVDVTSGVSEQLLGRGSLLSPSAVVRKIVEEKDIAKEKMEEIRRTALIESGLQKDLFAELRGESWAQWRSYR